MSAMRGVLATAVVVAAWAEPEPGLDIKPTRLVKVNVAAEDEHGRPVCDLAASELKVFDDGAAQKIELFRRDGGDEGEAAPPLEPGEFSNRAGRRPKQATVILFDVLNSDETTQGYVRERILAAMRKFASKDTVFLYLLTMEGLLPVRPLPETGGQAGNVGKLLTNLLADVNRLELGRENMTYPAKAGVTIGALQAMLPRLGAVPGRKNLIWITRSLPLDFDLSNSEPFQAGSFAAVRDLVAAVEASGTAIYPVELDGPLTNSFTFRPGERFQYLAQMTGGRFHASAAIANARREAIEDSRSSYVLGYYPPPRSWDGKRHRIRFDCLRKGVRLFAKTEYVAAPPGTMGEAVGNPAVRAAMRSPLDMAEIGLDARAAASGKGAAKVHFQLRIRAQDVTMLRWGDRFEGKFTLVYAMYDADGRRTVTPPTTDSIYLEASQWKDAAEHGIRLGGAAKLEKGVRKIRVVVFDNYSGAVGSVTVTGIGLD